MGIRGELRRIGKETQLQSDHKEGEDHGPSSGQTRGLRRLEFRRLQVEQEGLL